DPDPEAVDIAYAVDRLVRRVTAKDDRQRRVMIGLGGLQRSQHDAPAPVGRLETVEIRQPRRLRAGLAQSVLSKGVAGQQLTASVGKQSVGVERPADVVFESRLEPL